MKKFILVLVFTYAFGTLAYAAGWFPLGSPPPPDPPETPAVVYDVPGNSFYIGQIT